MLSRTKTHVRREKSSEKSINGQWCPLSAICRLKTHRFRHIFHCPQYFDLSDKKSLTCETVPLSVKPLLEKQLSDRPGFFIPTCKSLTTNPSLSEIAIAVYNTYAVTEMIKDQLLRQSSNITLIKDIREIFVS